jgi:hypothetical protein
MSVNRFRPHVLLFPEDDAISQLAEGFVLGLSRGISNRIQVLLPAGGWIVLLEQFVSKYVAGMGLYPARMMVLLIDFDAKQDRLQFAKGRIPEHVAERVFILGAWTKPEDLKTAGLGSYEVIGQALAADCRKDSYTNWGHDLLQHNAAELERLRKTVRPILFETTA